VLSNTTSSTASLLCEKPVRTAVSYAGSVALAARQAQSAPMTAVHGTSVSAAGFTRIDGTDANPGSPPREAPV
jgi:hypothetical protein